ncbi:PAS domain S-box protein [Flavobacterium reichenbachii]|uniref:PAS domain S-box protein n=1 Tax=Flavobacterium reichenbachii TaxID=362418 RepID=UPI000F4DD836|nr:PAS domain S-box protein [Flavobacterium reichenbachii]
MRSDRREFKYPFLRMGGEMGRLINEFNWIGTSLGTIEFWPESLRTSLSIMLSSNVPMFLVWGTEQSFFYNDSFRPFLHRLNNHPETLGNSAKEILVDEWQAVTSALENIVKNGSSKSEDNIIASLSRNNTFQEVYLTLSYSILFGADDAVNGVFVTCIENSTSIPAVIKSSSVRSQLNSVLMQSNAGIAQADIQGRMVEVNERYCQMLGYTREEILKMNLGELTHPDDLERNMILLEDCIVNGNDFLMTKRYIRRDGQEIWVNNSISLVIDSDGEKYLTAIAIDITAEKERENKLSASEARFRTLVAKAPVGTALFRGKEFYVDLANDVMLEYWGKNSEIIGNKVINVIADAVYKDFFERLQEVYKTGLVYKNTGTLLIAPKTLNEQYFDYSLTPLFNEDGSVYGILHMCSDVTLTVKAQKQIAASHKELAMIFEQSPVGIATINIDEDLVFQSANEFYCQLVGRQREEIVGKPLLEALPELRGQGFDDLLRTVINTGNPFIAKEVEVELLRSGKLEYIYVDLVYQINLNSSGFASSILVVATDVTSQVLIRREVEESETKLQNLIAAAPAGIGLFVGRDLIIEYPNQTFIDIVGKGPDIKGLPLREVMPELITEGQAYLKILDDIFTTGVPFISPGSLVKINQNGVLNDNYYNISYTPLKNKAGEIYAILDIAIDVTTHVQAQKEKEESEAHLQLLRDTVPAMIFYLDEEMRYCSYNSVFMEWFAVGEKDAIGKTVREFLGEAAYEKTLPHLVAAYGGEQEKYEMFAPSRMGITRWLSIVYTPHKNSSGKVIGLIVHATDITQSKITEIALRESESKLRSVLDAAPVAISLFLGEDLVIENPNQLFIENVSKGDAIEGLLLKEVLEGGDSNEFIQTVQNVYRTAESFSVNGIPGVNSIGKEQRYHNISLTPLLDGNGTVYAVLYVSSDVTKEIVSIKKIEQAEEILRGAVELAELGTWSTEIATGATTVSKRHAEIFGLKSTNMSLEEARSVIKDSDHQRVKAAFTAAQQKGSDGKYESEYKIVNGITGEERIIHSIGQTYFDVDGKPLVISGTAKDITIQREMQLALETEVKLRTKELASVLEKLQSSNQELEQSNHALKHSNEELAQFAYVASHDLQEPLRKIRFFADMLENGRSTLSQEAIIKKIGTSAERMRQLITDLLTFSRLVQPEKSYQPVDLNTVVQSIWIDFELMVQEKNASITIDNLPVIQAVGLQMNQLFYNLISNSLKFTKPDILPQIVITSNLVSHEFAAAFTKSPLTSANYYHIIFKDNGIGFEKNYENQIFEIFKRLHPQNIYPGSGIGLALCRRIVMNHQGILYAVSEPGLGSTFHIFLPDLASAGN